MSKEMASLPINCGGVVAAKTLVEHINVNTNVNTKK